MIEDVKKVQAELENQYIENENNIDQQALGYLQKDKKSAIDYLTSYSVNTGNETVKRWKDLSHYLLVKYIDGNIKQEKDGKFVRNGYTEPVAPIQPGYPVWYLQNIVDDTKDKLKVEGQK